MGQNWSPFIEDEEDEDAHLHTNVPPKKPQHILKLSDDEDNILISKKAHKSKGKFDDDEDEVWTFSKKAGKLKEKRWTLSASHWSQSPLAEEEEDAHSHGNITPKNSENILKSFNDDDENSKVQNHPKKTKGTSSKGIEQATYEPP